MANKLIITELDFESIKQNLKTYLNNQSTFKDYNFEGSGLAILIDLLAYNTHYNAYYMNMIANEMFMDTAIVRNSILSHAKLLNYIPVSRHGSMAVVDVTVTPPGNSAVATLNLERFQTFLAGTIDGVNYNFVTTEGATVVKESGVFTFKNVHITEGVPQLLTFTHNQSVNTANTFVLPGSNIDTTTLLVVVQESSANSTQTTHTSTTDITAVDANTNCYFLSTGMNNQYEISFGDGILGKPLANGNIVLVSYLTSAGSVSDGANEFITDRIGNFTTIDVSTVSPSSGGAEAESVDSIKLHAPQSYTAQNRAVTTTDYETLLPALYPNFKSVSAWGGEENVPPVFGKVFISYVLKTGFAINEIEKTRILHDLIGPKKLISVTLSFTDPDYIYLILHEKISIDMTTTVQSLETILTGIRTATINYMDTINIFGGIFFQSKLQKSINETTSAIQGLSTDVRIQKRFIPTLNTIKNYTIDFGFSLQRGGATNRMRSTGMYVNDLTGVQRLAFFGEVPNSFTGIDDLEIINAGFNYLEAPTITITGDGTGATATATVVNGQLHAVTLTSRGTNYTRAIVTITGGGGLSGTISPIVATRYGTMHLFYYNTLGEKIILNDNIGTINYETGRVTINNFNLVKTDTTDSTIRLDFQTESILKALRNQIFLLDVTDSSSLVIEKI